MLADGRPRRGFCRRERSHARVIECIVGVSRISENRSTPERCLVKQKMRRREYEQSSTRFRKFRSGSKVHTTEKSRHGCNSMDPAFVARVRRLCRTTSGNRFPLGSGGFAQGARRACRALEHSSLDYLSARVARQSHDILKENILYYTGPELSM